MGFDNGTQTGKTECLVSPNAQSPCVTDITASRYANIMQPYSSYTYEFKLTQYGSSWYHSHFALQYPAGLVAPLKINGPMSMNYDVDLGPVLLSDWYHKNPFGLFEIELLGDTPAVQSTLLQRKGIFCEDDTCSGSYYGIDFVRGTTYKLSIVNAGTSTQFTFWIDGHSFTVVGIDFVPIEGYFTDTLNVAIVKNSRETRTKPFALTCLGQRYDLIVTANAALEHGSDFWIHARNCKSPNANSTLGIIRYDSTSTALPHKPPGNRETAGCPDPPASDLVPVVPVQVGSSVNSLSALEYLNVPLSYYPDINVKSPYQKWILQSQSMYLNWSIPTLKLLSDNNDTDGSSFPPSIAPIFIDYPDRNKLHLLPIHDLHGPFSRSPNPSPRP